MTTVTFMVAKDIELDHGGDVALARVVLDIAAESFDVRTVCLSNHLAAGTAPPTSSDGSVIRVAKPPVKAPALLADSLRTRRSVCHTRFDVDELVRVLDELDSDVFVAEHSYMAESYLRSWQVGRSELVVNTVNSESLVWRLTRGLPGRIEAPRILADELGVARAASAVGTYDLGEAQFYRDEGCPGARWIDLTLPPGPRAGSEADVPRLVFMGTRDWPPNQEGFLEILELWPRIGDGIDGAELCIIGAPKPGATPPPLPAGVRDLGFVDDLDSFLGSCRALVAPISTGGGVRVKLLDAASRGLPVVGTTEAIGSLGPVFGLTAYDDRNEFVDRCRQFLLDADLARKEGQRIFDTNADRWQQRVPQEAVEMLLSRGPVPAGH
ncbi:glycosyltransferase [Gordonia sp. JH63]|uniref:glycosyltransferase n=1 Tax=Gordonia sp. JH63 TaxID=2698900 RepID=UPI00131FF8FE|nr:glycosyltransferase family 4 protein [Gordonia sp. JH63]QHD84826.1 glycosyltransferase [Gordonia sp. JH63]